MHSREQQQPSNVDHALRYAGLGWHVFPVKPRDKTPLTEHGLKDATTDEPHIRAWWTRWPDANVGISTGPSRLLVIDVDVGLDSSGNPKKGGESWNRLADELGHAAVNTIRAKTGSGGLHFYFQQAPEGRLGNSAGKLGPHLDTRGEGGYVVAPPSQHKSGNRYEWVANHAPGDHPPLPVPDEVRRRLDAASTRAAPGAPTVEGRIPDGEHHTTLVSWAGSMVARGLSADAVAHALWHEAQTRFDPPVKDEAWVRGIAHDVWTRYHPKVPPPPPPVTHRVGYLCRSCWKDTLNETAPNIWRCEACKVSKETPAWLVKRRPDGTYEAWEFGRSFTQGIAADLRQSRDPERDFEEKAARRGVPREIWPELRRHVEELAQEEDIIVDANTRIVFGPDGIFKENSKGSHLVIGGQFKILRVVSIEGERRVVVKDALGEFSGTLSEIKSRIELQILRSQDAQDVLANLIHRCPNKGTASFTYGVYADGDRLFLPDEYLPKAGDQQEALERVLRFLNVQPTPDDWQAYESFRRFFLPREWCVAFGLAAVAPFATVLRRRRQVFPIVYQYSREGGTGKTTMMEAMTRKLWNTEVEASKTLNSDFRFPSYLDMIALPWGFDEAQDFDWDARGGSLKQAMESEYTERRGTKNLTMTRYRSRLSVFMAANVRVPIPTPVLARTLIVHFLEERSNTPDAVRKAFKAAFQRLPTVGPALTRAGMDLVQNSEARLVGTLEELQDVIERSYRGPAWDNRRGSIWALLYWGLQVLEHASGGVIKAPPMAEFLEQVVEPVEEAGRESSLDPLTKLRNFIVQYIARGRRHDGTITGERELWAEANRNDSKGRHLEGYLVSHTLLEMFNDAHKQSPEVLLPTLKDLGQIVARKYGLPESDILPDRQAERVSWSGRQVRVVFLPMDEATPPPPKVTEAGGNGHNPPPSDGIDPGPLGQADRAGQLVLIVRRLAALDDRGAPEEEILAQAGAAGIPPPTASATLRRLLETGRIHGLGLGRFGP